MFFLPVPLRPGVPFRTVFARWGLDGQAQAAALAHRQNRQIQASVRGILSPSQSLPVRRGRRRQVFLMVPIDVNLTVTRYLTEVDLVDGLRPRRTGATGPPVFTHGMDVRIERNLGPGPGLRWLQTTTRLHDHTHTGRLTEFVDGADPPAPWVFPHGPRVAFTDQPAAPVPLPGGRAIEFDATATLAVFLHPHVVLAAGITWGFTVKRGVARPVPKPTRAATAADFEKQLRILRTGHNSFGRLVSGNLNFQLPPPNGRVVGWGRRGP